MWLVLLDRAEQGLTVQSVKELKPHTARSDFVSELLPSGASPTRPGDAALRRVVFRGDRRSHRGARHVGDAVRRYRQAFVSYASRDRVEVLKRVQMLGRLGIGYFQDVLDLEPGVRWERELYRHIDAADLFLLFWSSAARESEWVRKELRYAVQCKGGNDEAPPEILPVILEGPPPPPPPEELRHLHFNDYLLYLMAE